MEENMSILVRFTGAPGMTGETYDETLPLVEASGEFPPDGLEYHVAFSTGDSFRVSEIWDSREQFDTFGQRLMPILAANGVELAGPPEILEIHNIIKR
jgi:quinol monooxygenase YgiN